MVGKAKALRRRPPVSLSFSVKTCLSTRGMTVEMDNFANELATALEREFVRE